MKSKSTNDAFPKIVVGLDIGTTKIATIIGYKNSDGKIDVLGYGKGESTGVQHGLIYNITKTVDGINSSKETAIARADQQIENVFVGVAGRHIKSMEFKHSITRRNGKDEIIRQEEIDKMVDDLEHISVDPGETIVSVIPQKFIIDRFRETSEPVGELGELVEGYFQIITGNEGEIKKIIRCVNEADLDVMNIILEPIASGLSCLTQEEKKQGVALIDIGGGTTDLAIFLDGKPVFTRVIPIGGNIITKDISKVCNITEEMAEKLKTTYGTCIVEKSNKNNFITIPQINGIQPVNISETSLAQIINARVQEDIINEIKRAIDASGYSSKLLAGAVLTGGGATLKHIKELSQYTLQKPVRIGIPEIGYVKALPSELKHPMYATSLGLLKYGIEEYINAVPEKEVEIAAPVSVKKTKKYIDNGNKPIMDGVFKSIQKFFESIIEKTS